MKRSIRTFGPTTFLTLSFLAIFLLATSLSAQTSSVHPDEPGAEPIGSFTTIVELSSELSESLWSAGESSMRSSMIGIESGNGTGGGSGQLAATVTVFRTSSGRIDYLLDAATVTYSGDGYLIDGHTTGDLFGRLSMATVYRAIAQEYLSCPEYSPADAGRVYAASCVTRSGWGTSTGFTPCSGSGFCYRKYEISCGSGYPAISEMPRYQEGCGSGFANGCESTCSNDTFDSLN